MYSIWFEREPLAEFLDRLKPFTCLVPDGKSVCDPFAEVEAADAAIASVLKYDASTLARAAQLLVISRTGIGYENVDIQAASEYGIAVCNAPGGPTISTAEFTISLMLAVAKNIKFIEAEMLHGLQTGTKTAFYKDYVGVELYGKQLGLLGLGRIGSQVACIAISMGMRVAAYDPYVREEQAAKLGVTLMPSLEAVLRSSDVISLHLPLNDQTHKIMNAERFRQMKRGAIFINTARGKHVEESALLEAIDIGRLFGAGLDVTDPEPSLADNPLLHRNNIIVTPHIASGTLESKARIFQIALEQTFMVVRGERPPHLVNPDVWPKVLEKLRQRQQAT
jgi:D-3-phosphoglycerate dehydrogenase / 2-oxoglutarate reductase